MVISPRQQEFELWSRRFLRELNATENVQEWGEVIAAHFNSIGLCCEHHPTAYVTVKMAIDAKQKEFPP